MQTAAITSPAAAAAAWSVRPLPVPAEQMMPLDVARTLKAGDRVTLLEATMGMCEDDVTERVHAAGATGVVDTVEQYSNEQGWAIHVIIGEGERSIYNTFDESDYGGLYPFALQA